MGTVAATGDTSNQGLRRAAVVGSVMGSFTVEDFSTERLESADDFRHTASLQAVPGPDFIRRIRRLVRA